MANIQEYFNQHFAKENKRIELEDEEDFVGELVIEDYTELKDLYLHSVENVDKITLENLPLLENCTIWGCNLQEIIIENCPNIKKLNLRQNSLTSLDFLANLNNLAELDISGNKELVEILKPYEGNWRMYKKFLLLEKENRDLKESKKSLKKAIKEKVVDQLDEQLDKINQKIERSSSFSSFGGTDELTAVAGQVVKDLKGINDSLKSELDEVKTEIQSLEEKLKIKEKEINYLNSQLQEQGQKILSAYQYCVLEKEEKKLLDELLKVHIEFTKFKEKASNSEDYDEKIEEYEVKEKNIKDVLRNKIGKDKMNEIRRVLVECEKIAKQQLELETNLSVKVALIEDKQQILLQLPHNKENEERVRQLELELARTQGELKAYREQATTSIPSTVIANYGQLAIGEHSNFSNQITNNYYQQTLQAIEQTITQSLADTTLTLSNQAIINQTIIFLGTQELFLNYRQSVINNLIESYCQLANNKSKFIKLANNLNTLTGIASKLARAIPNGSVAQAPLNALSTVINLTKSTIQEKNLKKYLKKLQEIFNEDKKALIIFDESYRALISAIWPNNSQSAIAQSLSNTLQLDHTQLRPFSNSQNIYQLGEVWAANLTNLSLEELKSLLEKLDKNLAETQQTFQQQRKQLSEQAWFKTIENNTDLLKEVEQLENQIVQLDIHK